MKKPIPNPVLPGWPRHNCAIPARSYLAALRRQSSPPRNLQTRMSEETTNRHILDSLARQEHLLQTTAARQEASQARQEQAIQANTNSVKELGDRFNKLDESNQRLTSALGSVQHENHILRQEQLELRQRINAIESHNSSSKSDSDHMSWTMKGKLNDLEDASNAGDLFVSPTSNPNNWSSPTIAQAFNQPLSAVTLNRNGTYRVTIGGKDRSGRALVKSFINQHRHSFPSGLHVAPFETQITRDRRRCMKPLATTVNNVINQMPQLQGLKAYLGYNFSDIFLSYANKRDAFSARSDAEIFRYPSWRHFMKTSTDDFVFDPNHMRSMDTIPIFNIINEVVPPSARPLPEASMNSHNKRGRGIESDAPAGTSRARGNQ